MEQTDKSKELAPSQEPLPEDKKEEAAEKKFMLISSWGVFGSAVGAFIFLLGSAGFAEFAKVNNGKFMPISLVCLLFGALTLCTCIWQIKKNKGLSINRYFFAFLLSANFYFVNEFCLYIIPTDLANNGLHMRRFIKPYFPNILVGILLYFIFYFLAVAFTKRHIITRILLTVFTLFFAFYAIMMYYIVIFRGGPIRASDIANLTSAMEISDEYKFTFSYIVLFAIIDTVLMLVCIFTFKLSELKRPLKYRSIGAGVFACICVGFYFSAEAVYSYGLNNRIVLFNFSMGEDTDTYQDVGGLLAFYYDALKNHVVVPDNFDKQEAADRLAQYEQADKTKQRSPTIIAILNESFADFEHLGDIDVNMDYMPNIRALDNCIKGYVTVSPYGGYTCNSEFEFLTGNSMYFLPSGSASFTQYMNNDMDSLVSHLNSLDYNTVALTCCRRGLWKIESAYEHFGFDTAYFKDNVKLSNIQYINGNISDDAIYRRVEKEFKNKPKDESMFVWVTTMQNHAPYNSTEESDHEPVDITKPDNEQAQIYLNSIYEADKAVGELIEYFKDVDEDVVIVFFGDHYPHIGGFYDDMLGRNLNDLPIEDFCKSHQTPFFIWANYDIEDRYEDCISLNYLSNELMDVCGLPKSDYQNFLESIRGELPVVTSFGYVDGDGEWHKRENSADKDTEAMEKYRYLQYYRIFEQYAS